MIALDTNILVRHFVDDDAEQAALVQKLFDEQLTTLNPGYVTLVTLVELLWVLEDTYKIGNELRSDTVQQLLTASNILVEHSDIVENALRLQSGDIADRIIHLMGVAGGCLKTVTFDKKFARLDGVELLK